jgi:hypothetical protein
MAKSIGGHQKAFGDTDIWLSPPQIVKSLGEFDLDPCAPAVRPWDTAKHHYTEADNGLLKKWFGRVWLNPPYSRNMIGEWLKLMAEHDNGISLVFARTETDFFQRWIFPFAASILFIKGRLHFHNEAGVRAKANSGAPSVLISYGEQNAQAISESGIEGKHLPVNVIPMLIVGMSGSWKTVVKMSLIRLNGSADLKSIYSVAKIVAPFKVSNNENYQAKIRQQLQKHFLRVSKGIYSIN